MADLSPPASPRLSRRTLLRLGASLAGTALLAGCGRRRPQLLTSRGDLPSAWSKQLERSWSLELLADPAAVVAAVAAGRPRAGLVQLSDGWATTLPAQRLQSFGAEELFGQLDPLAAPVSRLFGAPGSPALALPWSLQPWVLLLRDRPDLARRSEEGWGLLLDPGLRGRLVLPSSPRVVIELAGGDPTRLGQLRRQALACDEREGLNLLLSGLADAMVLPRQRVVPLLVRDPRLQVVLPAAGGPLSWSLLLRPAAAAAPPLAWLAAAFQPPLLPRLLAAGWVPPLPRERLATALRGFPAATADLLLPPEGVIERWRNLPPLKASERLALQALWDDSAPATPPGRAGFWG
jgi:hypothetical protein